MAPLSKEIQLVESSIEQILPHLSSTELAGKKLFISGGTGFFGYWLLSTLALLNRTGANIIVTVLSRNPQRFFAGQPQFCNLNWLTVIQGNIRDFSLPEGRFDLLIHGATDTSTAAHTDPLHIFDDIIIGSRHILDCAVRTGVKRVLLISSGAVYGRQPGNPGTLTEDSSLACNTDTTANAYGEGKRCMEMLGTLYSQQNALEVVTARCFAFVGHCLPLDKHFAIGNFIHDALYADAITIQGYGTPVRSYLYGADLAVWLLTLLVKGKPTTIYNVGSDVQISIHHLACMVQRLLAPDKPLIRLQQPDTAGSNRNYYLPSIQRARDELGLDVWTDLQDAIRLTAECHTMSRK